MPRHPTFQKIHDRYVDQFGKKKGESKYYAWLNSKGYEEEKPFPGRKEKKEKQCSVVGVEVKELGDVFHVKGLIATDHIDAYNDIVPLETLESFANQINSNYESRVCGVHHSEGDPFDKRIYGEADVENFPAKVVRLEDGHNGLLVDTKFDSKRSDLEQVIDDWKSNELNSFSITYSTNEFETVDFDLVDDNVVRIIKPETRLFGYTGASNPVNSNAIATSYCFKEFKELVKVDTVIKEDKIMEEEKMPVEEVKPEEVIEQPEEVIEEAKAEEPKAEEPIAEAPIEEAPKEELSEEEEAEKKEFAEYKAKKKELEEKELLEKTAEVTAGKILEKMEMKEKVLTDASSPEEAKLSLEVKELMEAISNPGKLEVKEQFRRAAAACDAINLDWRTAVTPVAESREFKSFGVNGTKLEFKGLGVTTNQNTDTDYLQSSAELQDVYDPVIYNAINQETVLWNLLAKDNYSMKGNNQVQFTLKIAANASAAFYTGNTVTTDNVGRLKYQTKFKKAQVGVSVDGDMIAAARGGPVSDVFAQEVMDSTMDLLAVINAALFAETGLETAAGVIGLEYITDSAGNTSLYNLTRSAANYLAPDSATDTYINQSSTIISMTNLRAAKRQAILEGANKRNLIFVTNHVQGDLLRGKFDDSRRMLSSRDTDFGFSTDLFVDGIPVFEDKDCNTDDWFLVDLETHRVAIWVPFTIEKLGQTADAQDAFIKTYFATYNRAPRRMVQIYGCATS